MGRGDLDLASKQNRMAATPSNRANEQEKSHSKADQRKACKSSVQQR